MLPPKIDFNTPARVYSYAKMFDVLYEAIYLILKIINSKLYRQLYQLKLLTPFTTD